MNVLHAIAIATTSKEIDSIAFKRFMTQFKFLEPTDLTLVITIDNMSHKTDVSTMVQSIRSKFRSVDIVYANILQEDNVYETSEKDIEIIPLYGLISGPNLLFLNCMEYCKQFNTTLLLEIDCVIRKDFIQKLSKFVEHSGGFLIAGSTYDGDLSVFKDIRQYLHHLNGVALYKTSDPLFHFMLEQLSDFIIESVKKTPVLAYDIAMHLMIQERVLQPKADIRWKLIFKNVIKTPFIVNLSPQRDLDTENILKNYPSCVVLHKKFTNKDLRSLQGFLIQEMDL